MITPRQIYDATSDGLDIFALHFPDAREAAERKKPFKSRPEERTASAWLKYDSERRVWKMTDFGDGEGMRDPIAVHMARTGLGFAKAIEDLAAIFGVVEAGTLNKSVNRATIRKEPAKADQEDGSAFWDIDQEFTEAELKVMGPRVTVETMKALHWYRVKWFAMVSKREVTYVHSNENYPIFMRECWFTNKEGKLDRFYKIYQPNSYDKGYRFQYRPTGKKDEAPDYINGLFELKDQYKKTNDRAQKQFYSEADNEGKTFVYEKLPEAIICSGERDAICVRALGYFPIWLNSETAEFKDNMWFEINKYVNRIYNIPDIDSTGKIQGTALALQRLDLHTIWLPESLREKRDHRGNPCKDFRDYVKHFPGNSDFRKLLELGTPAKFWVEQIRERKRGGEVVGIEKKYSIDISCLHEFLRLHGFYRLRDKNSTEPVFIQIVGNVVRRVQASDVRAFVSEWSREQGLPRDLRNLVLTTPLLSGSILENLKDIELDFSNNTPKSQFFYFKNCSVEVTADGLVSSSTARPIPGRYVWEERVVDHDVHILPDMFEIIHPESSVFSEDFDIEVKDHNSNFFRYLINSSRLYWRKEFEPEAGKYTAEETDAYKKAHKFDIAGPRLTEDEINEQKRCLISKIFAIGYLLHRYKRSDRPWSPFLMDNVIGANDQCNGRSGKSFMVGALRCLTGWLKISGRNERLLDNAHVFEQIDKYTDLVVVDDCAEYFPFKQFYDITSGDMTINAKNIRSYTLKYDEAPKFAFTTNYVPREFDPSSRGRQLFCVFSDYYHESTEDNDYLESRQISTDFGCVLLDSTYPERNWEQDLNFMMQCCRFYLSMQNTTAKIEPAIDNIIFRRHQRDVSKAFRDWAEVYFVEDGDKLDNMIIKELAYIDFKDKTGLRNTTSNKFTKALRGFCFTCEYIDSLNPPDMCNSGNRIIKRVDEGPNNTVVKVPKEMIYVRSKREAERLAIEANREPEPKQEELPF